LKHQNDKKQNETQGAISMKLIASLGNTARSIGWGSRAIPLVAVLTLGAGSQAQAAPLNLTLLDTPDIVSSFIDVNYDATSDVFTASGFALELDDDGSVPAETITNGTFNLEANIDASGALNGGTFSIGGTVDSLGFNSGTLLTGNLTAFGFPDLGDDPLEFLFSVTGGDAAGLYGSIGGIVLTGGTGFTGDFAFDFSGDGTAVADVAPVPLPAAVWLFGAGLLGLVGVGRNRDRV
jgi:hypothetical protein